MKFTHEQRAQLEMISLYVDKPVGQLLTEAAEFLLEKKVQTFLAQEEMDARLAEVLRR